MNELIAQFLDGYGPLAVFLLLMLSGVGIPLGEDVITIPAGVFIASGHMPFWPTLVAAYVGTTAADVLWFWVCSRWGTPLFHKPFFKRLVHPRRLLEVKHQFDRRGLWIVVAARFIPSSRTTTITVAGIVHMPLWKFTMATCACVLITAPLQIALGYLIGLGISSENAAQVLMRTIGLVALLMAGLAVLRIATAHRRASRRRAPRARARWLRRFRARGQNASGATSRTQVE